MGGEYGRDDVIPGVNLMVTSILGESSRNTVYEAVDLSGRPYAAKISSAERRSGRSDSARLRRLMLSRKRHPNLATTHSLVTTPAKRSIVIMDRLMGASGRQLLRRGAPLRAPSVADIGEGLCRALAFLHEAGCVQGRLTPEKVYVHFDQTEGHADVKLLLATSLPDPSEDDAYLPPEFLGRGDVDERTDVFALAATLFDLAMAPRLLLGPSEQRTHRLKVLAGDSLSWSELRTRAPTLASVLRGGLATRPSDRPSLPQALRDLERCRAEIPRVGDTAPWPALGDA